MKLEGSNSEFFVGDEAVKKSAEFDARKKKVEEEREQKVKKGFEDTFNEIEVGYRVGYKSTPDTPVEFYYVKSKDPSTMTIDIFNDLNVATTYGIDKVTMDKIIDVDKNTNRD